MVLIHGDSHIQAFQGENTRCAHLPEWVEVGPFKGFWHGPRTCWNFGKNCWKSVMTIMERHWSPGDRVGLCVGEIDCRRHVVRFASPGKIKEKAQEVAAEYLRLTSLLDEFDPICIGIPPPTEVVGRLDHGHSGTLKEREDAARTFNETLASSGRTFWPCPAWDNRAMLRDGVHCTGRDVFNYYCKLLNG